MNIIKKALILGTVVVTMVGCSNFVPREDLYKTVDFVDESIEVGKNEIVLNRIEYPSDYQGKLVFLDNLEDVAKKLILSEKKVNLLISKDLYRDLRSFKKNNFLQLEEIYKKIASDLTPMEKVDVDSRVKIEVSKEAGEIQYYLNKQVYFWYGVLGRHYEFEGDNIYTELDKERLIDEVRRSRSELGKLIGNLDLDMVVEIDKPYKKLNDEKRYWDNNEIELFNPSGVSEWILDIREPVYIRNLDRDIMRRDLISNIVILDSKTLNGYDVDSGRYTFYLGGESTRMYYKGYDLEIVINESTLEDLPVVEDSIGIEDILKVKKIKVEDTKKPTEDNSKKSVDWGLN